MELTFIDRLRVLEDTVVTLIFGLIREHVKGCWRKLRNEELLNVYFSQKFITDIK
jgi:hypothetical protein